VTVILLIVGHRPVFQTGPGGDLLCPPQTAPRLRTNRDLRLSARPVRGTFPDSPNTTTACIRQYRATVHAAIAHRNFAMMQPPRGTIPGHSALPRQEHDRREPNMRGLELTARPGAVR